MDKKHLENQLDDEVISYKEDELDFFDFLESGDDKDNKDSIEFEIFEKEEESSVNIPLSGSPLYPRVYIGDSAKPLQGQFHESEYIDDNISNTWTGLLTSYYG